MSLRTSPPQVRLAAVTLDAITEQECVGRLFDALEEGRGGWIVTPNVHILRRCSKHAAERRLLRKADISVADGMPLIWACRLQGTPLPGRVAGPDLLVAIAAEAARRSRSLFLLGGEPGTAEATATFLSHEYRTISIKGTYCPDFGFELREDAFDTILQILESAAPDIVVVALSFPKGEAIIDRLRGALPQTWWIGVGNTFSFLCGRVRRAPRWMQACGLEWAHRVWQEPRRLWRRYFLECTPFAVKLLIGAIVSRFKKRDPM